MAFQTIECRQVEDVVTSLFHTLLLHRSVGKSTYKAETNYSLGVIGTEDVDCDTVDLTYVRVNSRGLSDSIRTDVVAFRDTLLRQPSIGFPASSPGMIEHPQNRHSLPQSLPSPGSYQAFDYTRVPTKRGRISLEFYQKRKRQWPLPEDVVPWEIWHLQLYAATASDDMELMRYRELVGDRVAEMIFFICTNINRPMYVPKMPGKSEAPLVFDERFIDVQPYLFRINHSFAGSDTMTGLARGGQSEFNIAGAGEGLTTTVKRLIKDSLSL